MAQVWPVIATRGRADWLLRQLKALLPQLRGDERIVVVVDGDADTSAKLPADERLLAVHLAVNMGVYHARRLGNSEVPTDAVVCEIDDHDLAEPTLLAELRATFGDPDAMIAYCDVWHADAERTIKRLREKTKPNFRTGGQLGWGMRAYRKWVYDLVGGYPTTDEAAGDFDLCARMEALAGDGGLRRIAKPLVTVLEHQSGISAGRREAQQRVVERVATLALNGQIKLPFELLDKPAARAAGPEPVEGPVASPDKSDRSDTSDRTEKTPAPSVARPRILLVAQYLGAGRGGGELSLLSLMRALSERGFEVHAAYMREAEPDSAAKHPWLTTHRLPAGRLASVADVLAKVSPSLVVFDAATGALVNGVCRSRGVPTLALIQFWRGLVAMTQQGFDAAHSGDMPESVKDRDGLAALAACNALVANSPFTAERAKTLLGRPMDAVVLPTVSPAVVAKDAPMLEERNVVMCPSVQSGKGSEIFLDLAARNPDLKFLLLAGDNAHSRENAVVARAKDMANVTVREDWVTDMAGVYAQCRVVFVGTLTCETFCRVAAEARANGVPLLAHDSGHLSVIARTGGVVVRRGATIDEWQQGLRQALDLRPEPSQQWIRDDADVFAEVAQNTRSLGEVALLRPGAIGVTQGCEHFRRALGCRVVDWPQQARDVERFGLAVLCGFWDADFAARRKGPLAVWYCSHAAQMDTSRHEVTALLDLCQALRGRPGASLALTSQPDAQAWERALPGQVVWLPNCLDLPARAPDFSRASGRRVFIVGHYDVRKNPYTAVAACALVGAEIHVTAKARKAPGLLDMASRLGAPVVVHDCATVAQVREVAMNCNAAVAVSSAETYCYAAAEAVAVGTPCVAWHGIPALRGGPVELDALDPTDVWAVSERMSLALGNGPALAARQWSAFQANAGMFNTAARAGMRRMLGV